MSSPTGPYLTVASCTKAQALRPRARVTPIIGPGNLGGLSCTGTFVTPSKKGTYMFGVTGVDSGGNQNLGAVIVQGQLSEYVTDFSRKLLEVNNHRVPRRRHPFFCVLAALAF